ncbi:uncharacterized protein F4822DRAFT_424812 [Hypoxylon trugodes]|uniref:uncharacterized protein n=1 Tax=Hypoxylon trugodes TaxID=326681 RepID=UPI00219B0521|nr:uncharacterized protein F4822DRAFT_424812 [Hypoxylon trugodes]KAI1394334.1 hypothetical protein F4822DRAFT_424812 [Hypoxylon trugodes]
MSTPKYHGIEANFLSLKNMQKLPTESEERKRKIIRRCNWYMFSSTLIRGPELHDNFDFFTLCRNVEANCPPEQEKPNQKLAEEPPTEAFLAKYHKPYFQGTIAWHARQDTISVEQIHKLLADAWERWQHVSIKAKQLEEAIDEIPRPELITKVVCLGLGRIIARRPHHSEPQPAEEDFDNMVYPRNIAQHIAAIAIVKQLEKKTGKPRRLYTADPEYGIQHKVALETFPYGKFTVLDPSYGNHEQFAIIDDSTLVFNMASLPQCPTMRIIQEYARPVAIITREIPREGKFQDRLWFEVTEENGNKVQIPGCADLPMPDGCSEIGGLCPKRVRDMILYEYNIEESFPAEGDKSQYLWGECDLVDYKSRDVFNTNVGGYWWSHTRLYARKSGLEYLKGMYSGYVERVKDVLEHAQLSKIT